MAANLLNGWCIDVMDLMRAAEVWSNSKPGSLALSLIQARKRNGSLVVAGSPRCSIKDLPYELFDLIHSHMIREVASEVDKWPSCSCCLAEHDRDFLMCDDCQYRCYMRCLPIGFCNCLTKKRVTDCSDCIDARFESHFNCDGCWEIMDAITGGDVSILWLNLTNAQVSFSGRSKCRTFSPTLALCRPWTASQAQVPWLSSAALSTSFRGIERASQQDWNSHRHLSLLRPTSAL